MFLFLVAVLGFSWLVVGRVLESSDKRADVVRDILNQTKSS